MAMIETKVVQIKNDPDIINEANRIAAYWGWTATNVQITHSQNTKTYSSALDQIAGNQSQTVETTTINYATVTYQRDKGIPNYARIVQLEKEYENIDNQLSYLYAENERKSNWGCFFTVLFTFICWPIVLIKKLIDLCTKSNKAASETNQKIASLKARQAEILAEAEALLV